MLDAWYYGDVNGENGDLCAWVFGSPLGGGSGARYNQVIGSGHYYLQLEWSNVDGGCSSDMSPPVNSSAPTAPSGTTQVGLALTAAPGSWTNGVYVYPGPDPMNPRWVSATPTYGYQWQRCGVSCSDITGATSSTYTPVTADVGSKLRVGVSAAVGHGTSGLTYSPQTGTAVTQLPVAVNTALPQISGTAQVGQVLTASPGIWTSTTTPTYAYQWRQCNAAGSCTDIPGATSPTYTLAAGDGGSTIRVTVVATNAGGPSAPATSLPTAPLPQMAAPTNTAAPSISGTAQVGQTLTASPGSWTSGATPTFTYQWRSCDSGGTGCTDIPGATSPAYTLAAGDAGSTIKVAVSATNAGGTTGPVASPQTAIVAAPASGGGGGGGTGGGGSGGGGSGGGSTSVTTTPASVIPTPSAAPTTTQAPFTPARTLTTHEVVVPKAVVLAAALTHGKTGKLRVKLTTGSGKTLVTATIKHKASLIAKVRSRFSDMKTGKTYTLPWKPPTSLRGPITVCMVATNSVGKSGKAACAAATVL